ncbi:uncharacterized protein H6S33_009728 [Morchella sextelata]|jgi:hypothetical protein|uniref:uncharacterized protein n=1 Tax=Morchella sextelata TaxID=1174677 RepID=UPI001D047968|nr:uncharacterized protein H6S33_009728 [Morchella sextelata]KAH0613348.1 hypothetical protein H6S33_009728 [Morchella sextelata]
MPPQAHWSRGTSAFPADAYSFYGNSLHKRGESSDLEPTLLAIPIAIVLVIGLASLLIIAHKNKDKSKDQASDPEGLGNARDEVALQEGKAHVETAAAPVAGQTPAREPDDAPKIPVEHNSYRPPQPQASEIDTVPVTGTPMAQPTRGLVYSPPLPEADEAAVEGGRDGQRQLHLPEVDGIAVYNIQQALEMDAARPQPTQTPVPVHHPAVPEADGRAVVGELPGAEEQMAHESDGAKKV